MRWRGRRFENHKIEFTGGVSIMYAMRNSLASMVKWGVVAPVLFSALAVTSAPAQATAGDLYAGANYGRAEMKDLGTCSTAALVLNRGYTCSADDKTNAWRLFGGYEVIDHLAVEFAYAQFARTDATASGTAKGSATAVTATSNFKAKGPIISAVGLLPVTKDFGLLGRVGIFHWKVETTAATSNGSNVISASDTKPGFEINNIGLGLMYSVSKIMDVRLEWDRYKDVGNTLGTGQADIDFVSLGLVYKF
jgi:OOP family OmpA-OmpF porin